MLSERLKQARDKIRKGQKEMAKLAGVSYRVWQSYEAGKVIPGGKIFESLSNIGFNANWLLTGAGEMMIEKKEDVTLSQKAVAKVKATDHLINTINNTGYMKHFATVFAVVNQYTKDSQQDMTETRSIGLMDALIKMTEQKSDDWKTKDNILYLLNIIEQLSSVYQPLREFGMSSDAAISLIRYLDNPNYMEHPEKFFNEQKTKN